MPKPPKVHRITNSGLERSQMRVMQMEAAQILLFTMAEMGEQQALFQCELEGVVESCVVRRVEQAEFDAIAKSAVLGAAAKPRAEDAP